jgi:hypothetical protein
MDFEKMIDWVNDNNIFIAPPLTTTYKYWAVIKADGKFLVKEIDKCTSWMEAVNLGMIRS